MIRIALASLGCKTNQYETDALAEWFRRHGFSVVDDRDKAEVYVLNTCTVTAEAERKARQLFRRYRRLNEQALIVACGCYAQRVDLSAIADIAVGTFGRSEIPALILDALIKRGLLSDDRFTADMGDIAERTEVPSIPGKVIPYEELPAPAVPNETRAFLKVQDGCDHRCAYCAISLARGPSRSRPLPNILKEAQELVARGFSEFVLTGTNLNLYGADFHRRTGADCDGEIASPAFLGLSVKPEAACDLADVILALDRVEGIRRLRLGSLEAGLITKEFIDKIADVESLCPSFHLSLQSGSDHILHAMRRRDTRDSYRGAVARIRTAFPSAGITTDLIVGFPGETRDDFEETLFFCDEIGFLRIHVFRFSSRPGTLAHKMPHQVPSTVVAERSEILRAKAAHLAEIAIRERLGQTRDVLIETFDERGRMEGYTPEYIFVKGHSRRADRLRGASSVELPEQGAIVPMRIVGIEEQTAIAEII